MLTAEILHELLDLLTPFATGGSGVLGLHTQVVLALGNRPDLLGRITLGGNAQEYITGLLKTLDEYGETSPGTRALWQFMSHLKTQVGMDKQARIDALETILNTPPLPTIQTASSAPRVFLSYARSDGEGFAHTLRASLERAAVPLWQDRVGMEGGRDWWLQITAAIEKVQFMVLVMTPNAMKSEVVRKEWRYARQHGVCVYPVKGASDLDFASLPKWMRDSHFYDLGTDSSRLESGVEWAKFLNDLKLECKTPRVPFMVEDIQGYVHRDTEFESLLTYLLSENRDEPKAITAALRGAGGYGKTTLARALCHDEAVQQAYDDGILWVELGESVTENNLFNKVDSLIYVLSGRKSDAPDLNAVTARLVEMLADRDILLVIDDVWREVDLNPFLQGGPRCTRLITTRHPQVLPNRCQEIPVDAMKSTEASHLLIRNLPGVPQRFTSSVEKLAARLGKWALLLKLANGVLLTQMKLGKTLEGALDYAERALNKRGLTAFDAKDPQQRHDAVSKTIGVTLELLSTEELEYFAKLVIFPDDVDVPLREVERLWGVDDVDSEDITNRLYQRSLLLDLNLQIRYLRLHDVIRQYLRERHGDDLPRWNGQYLEARRPSEGWHKLAPNEMYLWKHLAYHLMEAGLEEELRAALLDYRYLQAKLDATRDPNTLIEDCEYLAHDTSIRLVKSALNMSSHVLKQEPAALAHQLVGRLMRHRQIHPEILHLTNAIMAHVPGVYPAHPDSEYITHDPAGGALLRTLPGHTGVVNSAAYGLSGQRIVSASQDKSVRVWDAADGEALRTLTEHEDGVNSAGFNSDGQRIVSASQDKSVRVWDATDGKGLRTLTEHEDGVNSAGFSPDGQLIVSASDDGTVRVWNVVDGGTIHTFRKHEDCVNSASYSPDGKYIVSASSDRTVRVWDAIDGRIIHTLTKHEDGVNGAGYSPDGKYIVSASSDGTVRVWDAYNGAQLHILEGHNGPVNSVEYSPDGKYIVSTSWDKTVRVWDAITGTVLQDFRGHTDEVNSAEYSPDGRFIVSASRDKTVRVWNSEKLSSLQTPERHRDRLNSVAFSPNGQRIISASSDKTVQIWSAVDGQIIHTFTKHEEEVNSAQYSPNGKYIVSASSDRTVQIWGATDGEIIHTFINHEDGVNSAQYSPDGKYIVSASSDRTVQIWSAADGEIIHTLTDHQDRVNSAQYSLDGKYIVSASNDRTVRVWDAHGGTQLHILQGHTDGVTDVAITPNGEFIVSTSRDKTLKVWNLNTGTLIYSLQGHLSEVTYAALMQNQRIISASDDQTLKVWDLTTGVCLHTFYGDADFYCCAFSPDGTSIAAGDKVGRVLFLRWTGGG